MDKQDRSVHILKWMVAVLFISVLSLVVITCCMARGGENTTTTITNEIHKDFPANDLLYRFLYKEYLTMQKDPVMFAKKQMLFEFDSGFNFDLYNPEAK